MVCTLNHDALETVHTDPSVTPVLAGVQRQGDLYVAPVDTAQMAPPRTRGRHDLADGPVTLIQGEHVHALTGGPVGVTWQPADLPGPDLGIVTIADGAAAYLVHTGHHPDIGIGPGRYVLRRSVEEVVYPGMDVPREAGDWAAKTHRVRWWGRHCC